jgi:hypothetical protein
MMTRGSGHETQQSKSSQRSEFLNWPTKIPMPCSNKFETIIKDEHINYYCSWLNYKNRKNKSIIKIGRKKKKNCRTCRLLQRSERDARIGFNESPKSEISQ